MGYQHSHSATRSDTILPAAYAEDGLCRPESERPSLDEVCGEFSGLGDALRSFSAGRIWPGGALDQRTRQLAAVAVFAAIGHQSYLRSYAERALESGITPDELKDVIYFTTVPTGGTMALQAAETLTELFRAHRAA